MRCKSRQFVAGAGKELQCEAEEGHSSVHYYDNHWWPNKEGLPDDKWHMSFVEVLIGWVVVVAIAIGVVVFMLSRR